jgi:hypothetical protein
MANACEGVRETALLLAMMKEIEDLGNRQRHYTIQYTIGFR